ncbi:MAG TPA: triose-phosphate isomerase [Candidatus Aenigmarchaeota archaeon]|nr:triose-phosphate isomerase [Candidatus Aenigmarchaeota archaeon]
MLYIINFKTYAEATGINAIKLANLVAELREKLKVEIIVAPQFVDLVKISEITLTVAQHIDPITYGAHTGSILPQAIKEAGAMGTLLNHSEKKMDLEKIKACIEFAKLLELKTICCAGNLKEVIEISKFGPDYIAFEDPELIGTGKSITQHKPEMIERFIEIVRDLNPNIITLCGAGISNSKDVEKAKELGIKGVLVSSAIVKAKNQREALLNLIL